MALRNDLCARFLCFFLLLSQAFSFPLEAKDDLNRIVSLVPAITEQLYLLGVPGGTELDLY